VKLLKCLRAIKEFAFQVSEYPVVITFEDHLTANLQDKVAEVRVNLYHGILCSFIAGMVSSVPLV
jgi:phosphatidylinositol phospholipase C delta